MIKLIIVGVYLMVSGGVYQYCHIKDIGVDNDSMPLWGKYTGSIFIAIFWLFTLPFLIGSYLFKKYLVKDSK